MRNKGFTLIEFMIAFFMIIFGVIGTFSVLQKVTVSASISSSRLIATHLAQEGVEVIRNIRDTNWVAGPPPFDNWDDDINCFPSCESYQLDFRSEKFPDPICSGKNYLKIIEIPPNDEPFYCCSADGRFQRKIEIEKIDLVPLDGIYDKIEVTVTVSWEERGKTHKIIIQEDLYSWYAE